MIRKRSGKNWNAEKVVKCKKVALHQNLTCLILPPFLFQGLYQQEVRFRVSEALLWRAHGFFWKVDKSIEFRQGEPLRLFRLLLGHTKLWMHWELHYSLSELQTMSTRSHPVKSLKKKKMKKKKACTHTHKPRVTLDPLLTFGRDFKGLKMVSDSYLPGTWARKRMCVFFFWDQTDLNTLFSVCDRRLLPPGSSNQKISAEKPTWNHEPNQNQAKTDPELTS